MKLWILALFAVISCSFCAVSGCYSRRKPMRVPYVCQNAKVKKGEECKRNFVGRHHAENLALDTFRSVTNHKEVEQKNAALVPLEVARLVAAMMAGANHSETKSEVLAHIRCYISWTSKVLSQSLLVASDNLEDRSRILKQSKPPKMMASERLLLADNSFTLNKDDFRKRVVCPFDLSVGQVDFDNTKAVAKALATFSAAHEARANRMLEHNNAKDLVHRSMLKGDSRSLRNERAVLVSETHLRPRWKAGLFAASDILGQKNFFVQINKDAEQRQTSVQIKMLQTEKRLPLFKSPTSMAVALPLDKGVKDAYFVVVLPSNHTSDLSRLEREILADQNVLRAFLDNVLAAKHTLVEVRLPRMALQVTHEWTVDEFAHKESSDRLVGVYSDVYLELIENGEGSEERSRDGTNEDKIVFEVNRPFLFFLLAENQIVAFGRMVDPMWCKLCKNHNRKAEDEAKKKKKKKEEEKESLMKRIWKVIG